MAAANPAALSMAAASAAQPGDDYPGEVRSIPWFALLVILATIAVAIWIASDEDSDGNLDLEPISPR